MYMYLFVCYVNVCTGSCLYVMYMYVRVRTKLLITVG